MMQNPIPQPQSAPEPVQLTFRYRVLQFGTVSVCDLRYKGRVAWCKWDGVMNIYHVQYVNDAGEFKAGEFYEDELAPG